MNFSNHENGENLAFSGIFLFLPNLDYYKIRTKTNFENRNGKSLDQELFPGSTDFTVAIFKIPQISKHFSAMLVCPCI